MKLDPVRFWPDGAVGSAIVIAVMGRSVSPKAFERRMRIWEAGVVTWKVWRIVELKKTRSVWLNGGGGRFVNSVNCGMAVHVSTQWPFDGSGSMPSSGP